jgi:hypothetical protein
MTNITMKMGHDGSPQMVTTGGCIIWIWDQVT